MPSAALGSRQAAWESQKAVAQQKFDDRVAGLDALRASTSNRNACAGEGAATARSTACRTPIAGVRTGRTKSRVGVGIAAPLAEAVVPVAAGFRTDRLDAVLNRPPRRVAIRGEAGRRSRPCDDQPAAQRLAPSIWQPFCGRTGFKL